MSNNTEIVSRFIAAWEARNVDAIMAFFAPDAIYHNMPMPVLVGHAQIREFIQPFVDSADRIAFKVLHSAENAAGTVLNERVDSFVMKDGKKLAIKVVGIFECCGGKIVAWRDYFDMKEFEAQMAG